MNKKNIVSMHQPHYFPWLGQINKIACSEIFIVLDNVQFSKGGKMNRQKFMCLNGSLKYLTIPYKKKNALDIPFYSLEIANENDWQEVHRNFLHNNYGKYPHFNEIWNYIKFIYEKEYKTICEVVIDSTEVILKMLDINTKVILQSELNSNLELKNNEMIIELMKLVDQKVYLSGNGAKKYMDNELYKENNIEVMYQHFIHPTVDRYFKHEETDISILDILFNCGIEGTKEILKSTIDESYSYYSNEYNFLF